jgi:flavin-dependent dehydrogenase
MKSDFDLAIIGAGFSGSLLAMIASERGGLSSAVAFQGCGARR